MGSRELHTFKDRAGPTWFFQHSTINKHNCAERLWFKDNPYLTITYHCHNIIYHASTNKIYNDINCYRIISVWNSHPIWGGFKLEVGVSRIGRCPGSRRFPHVPAEPSHLRHHGRPGPCEWQPPPRQQLKGVEALRTYIYIIIYIYCNMYTYSTYILHIHQHKCRYKHIKIISISNPLSCCSPFPVWKTSRQLRRMIRLNPGCFNQHQNNRLRV